ncbi:MAG: ABC transporter substrate-binding protein [Anaerolineales bacterium]
MKSKRLVLLVVMILISLVTAQCASQGATQSPAAPTQAPAAQTEAPAAETQAPTTGEKVFKIGVLGPFTGPSARTGDEFKVSAQMALDKINSTIGDYKIEPVWIDSQSDPEKATRAYEEAVVKDGIQASTLGWHSSVAVALMELTAKYKIPHFFGFGATEVVNQKFNSDPKYQYWTTKGWPSPALLSENYVTAIDDAIKAGDWTPDQKTAAIYGEDTDWGRSFGEGLAGQLEDAGWKVVDKQYFPLDQTEFYPLLNKFKDENVALLAGTSTAPPSLSAFIKQADEVGLKSLIIADGLGWVGEWYNLTGKSSNYVVDQIPGWTTDASKQFAADFKAKSGLEPSPSSGGLAYDGMSFFLKVLQTTYDDTGELSSEAFFSTIKNKVWTGQLTYTTDDGAIVMTKYDFSKPPDPIVGKGYYTFPVLQYMDGVGQYIWPPEFANAKLAAKP